jgi:hypothetical protein
VHNGHDDNEQKGRLAMSTAAQEYTDEPTLVDSIDDLTAADLVGVAELADRLSRHAGVEITRSNVTTWIHRRETQKNGFPLPVRQLAMGGLYSWVQVLAWFENGKGRA